MVSNDNKSPLVAPRYQRNIKALSVEQVQALHTKKVCVIGSGGLGGYIVEILARIGVFNITLVDFDVFDVNNLNRQLFCKEESLGKYKVDVAKERIKEVNSSVRLTTIKDKFSDENAAKILRGHDLAIDALDTINTRLLLEEHCNNLNIPMVHGSIAGWYGQVCFIAPGDDMLSKLYRDRDMEKGAETNFGNLPFTASTIASFQCAEAIKFLTNKGTLTQNSVLQIDLLSGETTRIKL